VDVGPHAAPGGEPGLAASDPRARPRAEQFLTPIRSVASSLESILARSSRSRRLGGRPAPRPRPDRDARRGPQPLHERLLPHGAAPAPAPRVPGPGRAGAARRTTRDAAGRAPRARSDVAIRADGDQLEQLLINLVRNACDAALETGGGVSLGWSVNSASVELYVRDDGPDSPTPPISSSLLHDQAGGLGHRAGPEPPDRRGARRHADLEDRKDARGCEAR
jgi:hypothetical protein